MTSRLESLVAMFKTNFRFFYNDENSSRVALFKISCLAEFAPLLRLRFRLRTGVGRLISGYPAESSKSASP
jgi:hypothetical protein